MIGKFWNDGRVFVFIVAGNVGESLWKVLYTYASEQVHIIWNIKLLIAQDLIEKDSVTKKG